MADIKRKHGAKRGAIEKIIRSKGYDPKEFVTLLAVSVPAAGSSPEPLHDVHREIVEAVAAELGVDAKGSN